MSADDVADPGRPRHGSAPSSPTPSEQSTWRRALPYVALPALAVLAIGVAEQWTAAEREPARLVVIMPEANFGPADYPAELAVAERQLELGEERVAGGADQWLRQESFARAILARYKLNGSPQDLAEAGRHLSLARELAPPGSGPFLTSAEYAMTTHDLALAERELDRLDKVVVESEPAVLAEALGLRGDIAFYRGDMAQAGLFYDRADAVMPTASNSVRRAILLRGLGLFDESIAELARAVQRDKSRTPRGLAAYAMQIGMVESARGNYPEARRWFGRADRLFPGNWLTALYLAEAQAVAGEPKPAITVFERIARETGDPQAMDAAALLQDDLGNRAQSRAWSELAGREWQDRVELLPTAYMAHAFENELAFGDPAKALVRARTNAATRPYGDALILVAEALLATDQPAEARKQLLAAERTGWRSAPLYARLSEAERALGNSVAAEAAADKARAFNPHIFDPRMGRLWFGHG